MNVSRNVVRLASANIRQVSTTKVTCQDVVASGYKQLKNKQAKYQVKDGQPIFIKAGATDKILYGVTATLSAVGVAGILKLLFDLSTK